MAIPTNGNPHEAAAEEPTWFPSIAFRNRDIAHLNGDLNPRNAPQRLRALRQSDARSDHCRISISEPISSLRSFHPHGGSARPRSPQSPSPKGRGHCLPQPHRPTCPVGGDASPPPMVLGAVSFEPGRWCGKIHLDLLAGRPTAMVGMRLCRAVQALTAIVRLAAVRSAPSTRKAFCSFNAQGVLLLQHARKGSRKAASRREAIEHPIGRCDSHRAVAADPDGRDFRGTHPSRARGRS